jgi:hypothetical protein
VPPLLRAHIPASTQTALSCAPLKSSVDLASSTKLISLWFIFLEWILRIWTLASSVGRGNSILRSNRPDLINAGSRTSGLLVAQSTLISSLGEKLNYYQGNLPVQVVQELEHGSLHLSVS